MMVKLKCCAGIHAQQLLFCEHKAHLGAYFDLIGHDHLKYFDIEKKSVWDEFTFC